MYLKKNLLELISKFERPFKPLNIIEIDSDRILSNYDLIKKFSPRCEVWPVLKANAYGHGIIQVARILEARKFQYLVVDGYHEVLEIRKVSQRPVLIMGTILPENFSKMKWRKLTMMVQDEESIKAVGKLNRRVKVHLKINTGMNRQGIEMDDIESTIKLIKKYPKLNLEGVFSHLADADNPDEIYSLMQLDRFKEAIKKIEKMGVVLKFRHLSATAGILKVNDENINAVRLGIGLYGINPLDKKDKNYKKYIDLKPALSFKSRITKVAKLKKGERVSYNGIFEASKDTNIGIIPVGYCEGLDRRLSNQGFVKYKNNYCPIIGRVCMNLAVIDLGKNKAKLFDEVEVISNNSDDKNSIENMARICQTVHYDLLVKINSSIRRVVMTPFSG